MIMRIQRRKFLKAALASGCGFSLIAAARNRDCDISGLEKDLAGAGPAGQLNQGNPRIEVPEGWSLYWNDEFDGSTIDTSKWKISNGGRWLSQNAFISEGALQLRASMTSTEAEEEPEEPEKVLQEPGEFPEGDLTDDEFTESDEEEF